jgi:hypothetical protein
MYNARAEIIFENQRKDAAIAESCGTQSEDWKPMVRQSVTTEQVQAWICAFAATGDIEDELGRWTNHTGSVNHAVAREWIADRDAVGMIVAPAFWTWAKSQANLVINGVLA